MRRPTTWFRRGAQSEHVVLIAFLAVVVVRLAALIVLHVWSVATDHDGFGFIATGEGDDGRGYYFWAKQLAAGHAHHHVRNGFPTVLSLFMRAGLDQLFSLKLINTAVGLLTPLIAAAMVGCVVRAQPLRRTAQAVAVLVVGLYPTNVYLAENSLLRDVWVIAGLMAVAWLCGRAAAQLESDERSSLGLGVLWCIPLLAFVAWFRPYAAGLAVVGLIGGGLLAHFVLRGRRPSLGALALTVLGSLVVFFVLVSLTREPLHDVFGRDALHYRESRYLVGGSNIGLRYNENILHDTVVYLYSFFSNAFGPLPWQIDKPVMLVPMLLELPAFIVIVIVLVRGRHAWPSPVTLWCSMALVWLAALGVWNDNLGAALRLRAPAWILLAVSAVCVHFTARGAREGVQAASTDALSRG